MEQNSGGVCIKILQSLLALLCILLASTLSSLSRQCYIKWVRQIGKSILGKKSSKRPITEVKIGCYSQ